MMKKYLLLTCLTISLLACDKDNGKVLNPIGNDDTKVDLVQIGVGFSGPGGHGLSVDFNDKSFFYMRHYNLFTIAPIEWNNHIITYLPRGENKVSLSKFNFRGYLDNSRTFTQDFILDDAEMYSLHFLFEDELEVIVHDIS